MTSPHWIHLNFLNKTLYNLLLEQCFPLGKPKMQLKLPGFSKVPSKYMDIKKPKTTNPACLQHSNFYFMLFFNIKTYHRILNFILNFIFILLFIFNIFIFYIINFTLYLHISHIILYLIFNFYRYHYLLKFWDYL